MDTLYTKNRHTLTGSGIVGSLSETLAVRCGRISDCLHQSGLPKPRTGLKKAALSEHQSTCDHEHSTAVETSVTKKVINAIKTRPSYNTSVLTCLIDIGASYESA